VEKSAKKQLKTGGLGIFIAGELFFNLIRIVLPETRSDYSCAAALS
jgi:hypothetical protein